MRAWRPPRQPLSAGRSTAASGARLVISGLQAGEEGLDRRQDALDDALDPLGGRVQPVRQVEDAVAGDAVEEERVEHEAVLLGEVRVDRVEAVAVGAAEVALGIHAGEHDRDAAGLEPRHDGLERLARDLRIDAAQHVVRAELDDHAVGAVGDRPVEPFETPCGRIAGDRKSTRLKLQSRQYLVCRLLLEKKKKKKTKQKNKKKKKQKKQKTNTK